MAGGQASSAMKCCVNFTGILIAIAPIITIVIGSSYLVYSETDEERELHDCTYDKMSSVTCNSEYVDREPRPYDCDRPSTISNHIRHTLIVIGYTFVAIAFCYAMAGCCMLDKGKKSAKVFRYFALFGWILLVILFFFSAIFSGNRAGKECRGEYVSGVWPYDFTNRFSFEPVTDHGGEISKGFDKTIATLGVYMGFYLAFIAYAILIFVISGGAARICEIDVSDFLPVMKPKKV